MAQKHSETTPISRRRVLATAGSFGATALASCNALGGSDESAIKDITKQMAELTVTLRSRDAATAVNFINPDGQPVTTKPISIFAALAALFFWVLVGMAISVSAATGSRS